MTFDFTKHAHTVSDYIVKPIKKVLSIRIYLPKNNVHVVSKINMSVSESLFSSNIKQGPFVSNMYKADATAASMTLTVLTAP